MDAASKQEIVSHLTKFLETFWVPGAEVLLGFVLGPRVKKLILRLSAKSHNKGIMTFLGSCANILIIGISIILAAEACGVKMNSVIALLSALGLGISLALKSNMANVAGGLQILLTKPFTVGDYVDISGYHGVVTSIELMFSTLLTENQVEVLLPNANIVCDTIVNYSRLPMIRLTIPFTAPGGCDMDTITRQAMEILQEFKPDDPKQPPTVDVQSMNNGSITFEAVLYCRWQTCQETENAVKKALTSRLPIYNDSSYYTNSLTISNLDQLRPELSLQAASAASVVPAQISSGPAQTSAAITEDITQTDSVSTNQNSPENASSSVSDQADPSSAQAAPGMNQSSPAAGQAQSVPGSADPSSSFAASSANTSINPAGSNPGSKKQTDSDSLSDPDPIADPDLTEAARSSEKSSQIS